MHFFRICNQSLLLTSLLCLSLISCKKTEAPVVKPVTTGTLDGTIVPVGTISLVELTYPGTINGLGATPDVQGYFNFSNVEAGTYNVSFKPKFGYDAPAPQTVVVTATKNTSLGTITVRTTPPTSGNQALNGTLTWQVDGVARTGAVASGNISFLNGLVSGLDIIGTFQNGSDVDKMELIVPSYRTPALYNLDYTTTGNYATYLRTSGGVPTASYGTKYVGIKGTVTVTAHNLTTHTISGTFGYIGYMTNTIYQSTISNGTFTLSY
jgi:hypothetical protein